MKRPHFILKLFIITVLLSCSSDDEMTEVKTQSVRIKAVALIAPNFPSTEGDVLEVYGTISTKLVVLNEKGDVRILWSRTSSNWEPVGRIETSIASEDTEHVFTVTEEEIKNTSIEFHAKMWDKDPDGNPNDYLGESIKSFQIDDFDTVSLIEEVTLFPVQLMLNDFDGITLLVRFTAEYI
tara:strand:+ start:17449 stop:17991 length:543 start_codon:yes stop_codon:yes gene_type:complete